MTWFYLLMAILFEVCGTTAMKLSDGFERMWSSVAVFVFYGLSLTALTFAIKKIDISIAYAIWSGLGTALIAVIGIYWFREPVTAIKIGSIALIIAGVVGLNLIEARN